MDNDATKGLAAGIGCGMGSMMVLLAAVTVIGCGGIVLVLCAGLIDSDDVVGPRPRPAPMVQVEPLPPVVQDDPLESELQELSPGARVAVAAESLGDDVLLFVDLKSLSQWNAALQRNDVVRLDQLSDKVTRLTSGTRAIILDGDSAAVRIRVAEGPYEKQTGWIDRSECQPVE